MNKIKVLQIGMTSNIGGLETYLMQQFDHIDKNKLQYDFVNITAEKDIVYKEKIITQGSKIYNIKSRHSNPIRHYWQWCKLLDSIKGEYKAIVLNSNSLAYIFPLFAAKFFDIPTRIMHSHNSGFEGKVSSLRKLVIVFNRVLMNCCVTKYFACSEKAGRWMFGNKDFTIIHNAIDIRPYCYNEVKRNVVRKQLGLGDRFVIGHVGRFTYQKNHEQVIEIFNAVYKEKPDAVLLLVGDAVDDSAFLQNIKRKVLQYGLKNAVKFLGMRTDVPDLMQAMDAFLLPSRFEGLCLVGIEAQSSGLPCFFSDTITRELEITDLCHFIGLDKAPEEWAKYILENSPIERRDMSKEISDAGYDIKTEVKKIERIYRENWRDENGLLN